MTKNTAEKAKMCPLISARRGRPWLRRDCLENQCAWWVESSGVDTAAGLSGQCAIKTLAMGFSGIPPVA